MNMAREKWIGYISTIRFLFLLLFYLKNVFLIKVVH
jgi:hypothetical protein